MEYRFEMLHFLRCRFSVVTSDGLVQKIEISPGQRGSTFRNYISNRTIDICNNIFCFDHHSELNLFVAVHKNSGMFVFGWLFSQLFSVM